MAPTTRNLVLGTFVILVSVSAVALGRHHRPFSKPPVTAHMAPHSRSIVIEQHPVVEKTPVAPVTL